MRLWCVASLLGALLMVPRGVASAQAGRSIGIQPSPAQFAAAVQFQPSTSQPAAPAMLLVDDPYRHGTRKEGIALMIVGAAGIVTGLIVDEPIVTVLSAGVGGLGLYFYLR